MLAPSDWPKEGRLLIVVLVGSVGSKSICVFAEEGIDGARLCDGCKLGREIKAGW